MVSTDHPRIWAIARWLPAAILAVVSAASTTIVIVDTDRVDAAALGAHRSIEPASSTPVLSLRRAVGPLERAIADGRLRRHLDTFVASQPSDTCLTVRSGEFEYDHRGDDPQTPASLQKLVTATAVLLGLGADTTFRTDAIAAAPVDGVVQGDLHLRGGGDPILATSEYMARERNQPQVFSDIDHLADEIVRAGVTEITGSVLGDESRYDVERYNPRYPSRLLVQGVIGPLTALSVNDGFAHFPDVRGIFGASEDPPAYAATVLDQALRERGVVIAGEPGAGGVPPELEPIAWHDSPPVSEIVEQLLAESDNNTAELLLVELGLQREGSGSIGAGTAAVATTLLDHGITLGDVVIADGSGLASENTLTCALLVELLADEATRDAIDAGLPSAGESGTLARRWRGTDLVGRVRAKTGTLNQVTGLAGHVDASRGAQVTFALIVNLPDDQFVDGEMIGAQQGLAEAMLRYPEVADLSGLRPTAP